MIFSYISYLTVFVPLQALRQMNSASVKTGHVLTKHCCGIQPSSCHSRFTVRDLPRLPTSWEEMAWHYVFLQCLILLQCFESSFLAIKAICDTSYCFFKEDSIRSSTLWCWNLEQTGRVTGGEILLFIRFVLLVNSGLWHLCSWFDACLNMFVSYSKTANEATLVWFKC